MNDRYDVAQVCNNGHLVTPFATSYPDGQKRFCSECGAATTMACAHCNGRIRGAWTGALNPRYRPPAYCEHCGTPYPWTASRLQAARELADLDDSLQANDREQLKADLVAITSDTPQTKVAATRLGLLLKKMGAGTARAIRDIAVDIASEAAKRVLLPPP